MAWSIGTGTGSGHLKLECFENASITFLDPQSAATALCYYGGNAQSPTQAKIPRRFTGPELLCTLYRALPSSHPGGEF